MRRSKLFLILSSFLLVITLDAQVQLELKLGLDNSTAILDDVSDNIPVKIFPNPTSGNFTIETPDNTKIKQLNIYDQVGSKIRFERNHNQISLPTALAGGIYNIQGVLQNDAQFTARIVIR